MVWLMPNISELYDQLKWMSGTGTEKSRHPQNEAKLLAASQQPAADLIINWSV